MCRALITFFWCAHIQQQTWFCAKAKKPGVLSRIFNSDSTSKPCKRTVRERIDYDGLCPDCKDRYARQVHRAATAPTTQQHRQPQQPQQPQLPRRPRQPRPSSTQVAREDARRAAARYGWVEGNSNADLFQAVIAAGHDLPQAPPHSHTSSDRHQPLEDLSLLTSPRYLDAQAQYRPEPLSYPQSAAPRPSCQHLSLREQYRISPPAYAPSPVSELDSWEENARYSPVSDL